MPKFNVNRPCQLIRDTVCTHSCLKIERMSYFCSKHIMSICIYYVYVRTEREEGRKGEERKEEKARERGRRKAFEKEILHDSMHAR